MKNLQKHDKLFKEEVTRVTTKNNKHQEQTPGDTNQSRYGGQRRRTPNIGNRRKKDSGNRKQIIRQETAVKKEPAIAATNQPSNPPTTAPSHYPSIQASD